MKARTIVASAIMSALLAVSPVQARGCLKGALVGGVAGHYLGHHGVFGAALGCLAGRHQANRAAQRPRYDNRRHDDDIYTH